MKNENVILQERITVQNKTYYLDLKVAENGSQYLVINQVSKTGDETERVKMILFEEELKKFGISLVNIFMKFQPGKRSAAYLAKVREDYPNAYMPWSEEADNELRNLLEKEEGLSKIAEQLGRKETAIIARMKRLELQIDEILDSALVD